MKKFLLVLLILITLGTTGGMIYFIIQYRSANSEKEVLITQNAMLQQERDAIGPVTTAYTVLPSLEIEPGDEVLDEHLVALTVPVSAVTENTCLNKSDMVGRFYKVHIDAGTIITQDVLMETDDVADYAYERDLVLESLPVGIEVGDYVSFRMQLPYGQEFIIYDKKRVKEINETTIKIDMSETDLNLWTSITRDQYIYSNVGFNVYIVKYNEPGVIDETVPFYPVREEMYPIVTLNPNIPDKTRLINSELRKYVDYCLELARDEDHMSDSGQVAGGNSTEASAILSDYKAWLQEQEQQQDVVDSSVQSGTAVDPTAEAMDSIDANVGEMLNQPDETID